MAFFLFTACKKEPVTEMHPDFIGTWYHYESVDKFKYLTIKADSKGEIWYSNGWDVYGGTQTRKWLIKNNNLHFGWTSVGMEKFEINQYPTIADSAFISDADTVEIGDVYIILDNAVYK